MNFYTLPLWAKIAITIFLVAFFEPYGVIFALVFWALVYKGKRDLQARNFRANNRFRTASGDGFMDFFGYSSAVLIPLLAYYMFVQTGAASNLRDALEQLNQMDSADIQNHMAAMLHDHQFMEQMFADQQFMESLHSESLNLHQHFSDVHHLDELSRIAAEEGLKMVTPVEQGGYNLDFGNTFNDIGAGGLQDHHHVTDPGHGFGGHDFASHDHFNHDHFHHNNFGGGMF